MRELIEKSEAIHTIIGQPPEPHYPSWYAEQIKALPSKQPEPLTDEEQRIFLSAMERELEVCKEIDSETVREAYEVSLTRICKEIQRKVKGALWT